MRLNPKLIPVISCDVLNLLMRDGDVEVEPLRVADAEMDLSAVMREYFTSEDRLDAATREALERRGYDYRKFREVKLELADVHGFQVGNSELRRLSDRLVDQLLASPQLKVVVAEEGLLAQKILIVIMKHVEDESPPQVY